MSHLLGDPVLQQLRRSLHPGSPLQALSSGRLSSNLVPRDGVFTFRTPTFKLNQISTSCYVLIVQTLGKSSNLCILPTIPPLGMLVNFILATYVFKNCFLDLRCTELVDHHPGSITLCHLHMHCSFYGFILFHVSKYNSLTVMVDICLLCYALLQAFNTYMSLFPTITLAVACWGQALFTSTGF